MMVRQLYGMAFLCTIAWLQRCRAILIRYDKKPENYEGLVQLACALLWSRRLQRLGWGQGVSG
jgi:hypothetical protein